jgi:serine/threonine protein kinase
LFREIKLWLELEHKNIVPLWGVADGFGSLPALVSPWLENGALTGYLQRKHEVLSYNQKFALVRSISHFTIISMLRSVQLKDIARGLQYHMFDVCHRCESRLTQIGAVHLQSIIHGDLSGVRIHL